MRRVPPRARPIGGPRATPWLRGSVVSLTLLAVCQGLTWASTSSATGNPSRAEVAMVSTARYGSVLVVGSGPLRGFPLYIFSGDADGRIRCGTTLASGYDLGPNTNVPLSCTGPESDLPNAVKSDDWPAFTTKGPPIAVTGVNSHLLGAVKRRGIGDQVTYAGHPLYLFDPVSKPFYPQGEGYMETVKPLAPWHGYWFLASSINGEPAPGTVAIETGVLPNGKSVLAVEVDENVNPIAATVYAFSRDRVNRSACSNTCALTWVPVLTLGEPRVASNIPKGAVGIMRRASGAEQVTFKGAPLYFYAKEKVLLAPDGELRGSGTAGNGEGVKGPSGGTFGWIAITPTALPAN